MKTINIDRMRKRALAAQPVVKRDRSGNAVHERCGWTYIGEPGAAMMAVQLDPCTGLQYAVRREDFDAMDDEEFCSRMEYEQMRWGCATR